MSKSAPPFPFVLEALERVHIHTRPMFGALAVYVGDLIVLILRERDSYAEDNGVWVVSELEHQPSLRRELPSIREIFRFADGGPKTWLNIPLDSDRFEEDALRVCDLILRGDPRIGRVPERVKKKLRKSQGKKNLKTSSLSKAKPILKKKRSTKALTRAKPAKKALRR